MSVRDAHHHPHVVLDQQHGDAAVAHLADELHQLDGLGRVHARRRLVEQQELGLGGEGARDLEPPLMSVRQVAGEVVAVVVELDELEQLVRALARLAPLAPEQRRAQHDVPEAGLELGVHPHQHVLEHRHLREQPDVLERARDPRRGDHVGRAPRAVPHHVGAGAAYQQPTQERQQSAVGRQIDEERPQVAHRLAVRKRLLVDEVGLDHGFPDRLQIDGEHHAERGQEPDQRESDHGASGERRAQIAPLEQDGALAGLVDAGDGVEDRGLAGAVGPDHRRDPARLDFEVDFVDRGQAAEADGEVDHLEHAHARPPVWVATVPGGASSS